MKRLLASALVLGLTAPIVAHQDDPKEKDDQPPYAGPSYRRAIDGPAAGMGFPAQGVELQSWITILDFDQSFDKGMDCWGYVSPSGREYAIIGLSGGTGFVEITEPDDAQIVEVVYGPVNGWRDIKTYRHYAYIVTEATSGGIQVVDLSDIDAGDVTLVNTVTTGGNRDTHNVAINVESGFLYRAGGGGDDGLRFYDLNADPVNPPFVGAWHERYAHDVEVITMTEGPYAGREIAFSFGGFNGGWVETGLDILDVTDKKNVVQVARYLYPNGAYSHQGWVSDDRRYVYLNDEFDEQDFGLSTTTHVIDISDLENPFETSTFTSGSTSIDHNLFVRGNYIFESNYRSGLKVFDATDPEAPVQVAYFDTYPKDDAPNFNSLWGNYPFFPSGTVIGSDKEQGLFVWKVDVLDVTPGDATGDGVVDFDDVLAVLGAWGDCPDPPEACPEDLDDNGVVDFEDLLLVLGNWTG